MGLIRRCRPGRGGVSHHLRRRLAAVLSLDAFIGIPPAGCSAGDPITYNYDITLISRSSMAAARVIIRPEVDELFRGELMSLASTFAIIDNSHSASAGPASRG